ncbi:HAD-like protein [Biscogniauxia marginata]|nr:HAD-like protein [Biscogniauxia marginata]
MSPVDQGNDAPSPQAGTGTATPTFPPVRACIFDMDGLLINTEDLYTICADAVLARHGRPPMPWSVKAQLMGVPGGSNSDAFHAWARLPIPRDQYRAEQAEEQRRRFPECAPLPGAARLLRDLRAARTADSRHLPVQTALATSSERRNYELKTAGPAARALLGLIPEPHRVLGDDPRVARGRGKPAPDIYLLALRSVNDALLAPEGQDQDQDQKQPPIRPDECLVFEDSVLGVEAGRRAGMRVVWVPHPGLAAEYRGREREVLAGRTGMLPIGDEHQLGRLDDGWAEQLASLEDFPYERFGIVVP